MTNQERLEDLERRVTDLEQQFEDLLRVFKKTGEMTPIQRRAIRRKTAARARAKKPVGPGKGAVKSKKTQRRLNREVE